MVSSAVVRTGQDARTGRFLPGNTMAAQRLPSVAEVLDTAGTRREAIKLLWDIARDVRHRDRYRAIERIVSYYFGTPRIQMDITSDDGPAAMMRQLFSLMNGDASAAIEAEGQALPLQAAAEQQLQESQGQGVEER